MMDDEERLLVGRELLGDMCVYVDFPDREDGWRELRLRRRRGDVDEIYDFYEDRWVDISDRRGSAFLLEEGWRHRNAVVRAGGLTYGRRWDREQAAE